MNIFKCADCHEESWFADGTDGHCLKCEAEGRKEETREEFNKGVDERACDCSQHAAKWLNDTQEWQCLRCYKKHPRPECQCDGCQKRFGMGPKTEWSACNKHIKYESGPPIDLKIESLVMTKRPKPAPSRHPGWPCVECGKNIPVHEQHFYGDDDGRRCFPPCSGGVVVDETDRLSPLPDNSHYKQGSIDPLQYVEAIGDAEYVGACILNVVKYVTRYRFKGSALDDLAKARDYVDRLIAHQKKKEATSPSPPE